MKPTNSTLNALLATGEFYVADIYVFTLVDGTVLRYCAGDRDVTYLSTTYPCGGTTGPYFERAGSNGTFSQKIGVEVDTLEFDVIPKNATIEGFPFLTACRYGIFDGADLELFRAFMPTYGNTSAGLVNVFTGRVVEIDVSGSYVTFNINSHLELLNQQMPRELYQAGCLNTLFDGGCTLNRGTFAVNGTVQSGSTVSIVNTVLSQDTAYFDLGTINFTSGNNNGFSRSVKSYISAMSINLLVPLPFAPAAGDTFTIYPGCDKMQSTCQNKYNNLPHFRGQPYVPEPETGV